MQDPLRISIGQINPTVGDFSANVDLIIDRAKKADQAHADLIVFPEMALCGYPVWDLANKSDFIRQSSHCLKQIVNASRSLNTAIIVGYIDRIPGERSKNALALIDRGKLVGRYFKRLLPTYDVFLEEIFFEPGEESPVFNWRGYKIAPTICEDIWDEKYAIKPVDLIAAQKADLIINISASPYYQGVAQRREELLKKHALRAKIPILYVNQYGGQDDLIFDGRSLLMNPQGKILFRGAVFEEDASIVEIHRTDKKVDCLDYSSSTSQLAEVYQALVLGIKDYCKKNRFKKVIMGLSGGIDSALVACLASDALGPNNVKGISMPSPYSSVGSWKDSLTLAKNLKIECYVHPIAKQYQLLTKTYLGYQKKEGKKDLNSGISLAMENLQARLRGIELMYLSNDEARLLLSTGNKSEIAMGYCTLYGDMCGGLAVLGDVYKTDVYRLAYYRNSISKVIPDEIISKAPSAELRPNQKDQDSLPPYELLDEILYLYIEKNYGVTEIGSRLRKKKISIQLIAEIIRKVDHNEYKRRQTPPILRVTEKAWFGRRMPITNRFDR